MAVSVLLRAAAHGNRCELFSMQVTIHKTGKISQSSNVVGTTHYTLEFDATADWTNTLMGWNGVADTMDQLRNRFRFETPAEAIYFCETNGTWVLSLDRFPVAEDMCSGKQYLGEAFLSVLLFLRAGWKWELIQDRQETPEDEDDNLYDYNFLPRRHKVSLSELGPRKGKRQWDHSKAGNAGWANLKRSQYGLEAWNAKPAKKAQ